MNFQNEQKLTEAASIAADAFNRFVSLCERLEQLLLKHIDEEKRERDMRRGPGAR